MEGPHSPFGLIWQIASATGWSLRYILWGINYQTLVMMIADQARYVTGSKARKTPKHPGQKGKGSGMFAYYQTKLNEKGNG